MMLHLTVKIDNVYPDGTVTTTATVEAPAPPTDVDSEEYEDWAMDYLFPHTGTGRDSKDDAGYFVEITAADDPALVGRKFEWGI